MKIMILLVFLSCSTLMPTAEHESTGADYESLEIINSEVKPMPIEVEEEIVVNMHDDSDTITSKVLKLEEEFFHAYSFTPEKSEVYEIRILTHPGMGFTKRVFVPKVFIVSKDSLKPLKAVIKRRTNRGGMTPASLLTVLSKKFSSGDEYIILVTSSQKYKDKKIFKLYNGEFILGNDLGNYSIIIK